MKKIILTQGKVALVDNEDFEELIQWHWHAHNPHKAWYAARADETRRGNKIYMHRFILGTPYDMLTDHKDGDGLNNQRDNLRICTHRENAMHKHAITGAVKYRGVSRIRSRYKSHHCINGTSHFLGQWASASDAARAYDESLIRLSPDFGVPNFVDARVFDYDAWRIEAKERKRLQADMTRALARRRPKTTTKTPYRGVHFHKTVGSIDYYIARIGMQGKQHYLGYFDDPLLAALAYDEKGRALGKPEASLNFPMP